MSKVRRAVVAAMLAAAVVLIGAPVASATTTVGQDSVGGPVTVTGDADGTDTDAAGYLPTTFTGNDLALAAGSTCTLTTGPGVTPVSIDCSTHSITANLGNDDDAFDVQSIYGASMTATVNGGGGDDTVYGSSLADTLNGDGGHDYLRGDEGDDTLSGGAGDDQLDGGPGADTFSGGPDDDLLQSINGDPDVDGNVDCGSGTDIDATPDPAGTITGCERTLPHFTSPTGGVINSDPVAGYGFDYYGTGFGTDTSPVFSAAFEGSTPDYYVTEWYLCTDAVETQDEAGNIDPACSHLGLGSPIGVPAGSEGKYLGGVVTPGLDWKSYTNVSNYDGETGLIARKIVAASPWGGAGGGSGGSGGGSMGQNPFPATQNVVMDDLPKAFKCKTANCVLAYKTPGPGDFTVGPVMPGTKQKPALASVSTKTAYKAGVVKLPVGLTAAGKKQLKKKHKLTLGLRVSFHLKGLNIVASNTTKVTYKVKKKK
jgi:hypothetical protein